MGGLQTERPEEEDPFSVGVPLAPRGGVFLPINCPGAGNLPGGGGVLGGGRFPR